MIITDEELMIAKRVSRKMGSRWNSVDWEDLNSYLTLWLCEHQDVLVRWRNEEGGMGKLSVALTREASKYAMGEQKETNGGILHYDIAYKPQQVESALPFIWEFAEGSMQKGVPEHPQFGTPIVDTNPLSGNTFGDAIAILSDISSAYFGLSKSDQEVLRLRFREEMRHKAIGKKYNITEDAARKRINRAIERISQSLTSGSDIDKPYKTRQKEDYDN